MNTTSAEILKLLAEGIHPITGEIFPEDHVCSEPAVIRALYDAVLALNQADSDNRYINRSGRLNAGRPWTTDDDAQLRDLFMQDTPMEVICIQLHRRKRGVINRLEYLKLVQKEGADTKPGLENAGAPWYLEDDEQLRAMFDQKLLIADISAHFKRTHGAIRSRMVKLGLIDHKWQYVDGERPWTQHDTELLKSLYEDGVSLPLIAAQFDRSENAIRARLFYMGLIKDAPEILPKRK